VGAGGLILPAGQIEARWQQDRDRAARLLREIAKVVAPDAAVMDQVAAVTRVCTARVRD
jgi:hypothetical protein